MRGGWVYIMSNRRNGTLYTGVTADIVRRAFDHRTGCVAGFTRRYRLNRLIWFEPHDEIVMAI
ncbi:GIY-YIG nuclease family protein [Rhodopila sp.]|uniref:GIY-YIG nuclease family protein n=1 Tax=Rhodopila sp. TaxID=2480087 RepID=UPI003D09B763